MTNRHPKAVADETHLKKRFVHYIRIFSFRNQLDNPPGRSFLGSRTCVSFLMGSYSLAVFLMKEKHISILWMMKCGISFLLSRGGKSVPGKMNDQEHVLTHSPGKKLVTGRHFITRELIAISAAISPWAALCCADCYIINFSWFLKRVY